MGTTKLPHVRIIFTLEGGGNKAEAVTVDGSGSKSLSAASTERISDNGRSIGVALRMCI